MKPLLVCICLVALETFTGNVSVAQASPPPPTPIVSGPQYSASFQLGRVPKIVLRSHGQSFFRLPAVSGLSSTEGEEKLSAIEIGPIVTGEHASKVIIFTAKSSIWLRRRFVWRFFPDHVEFQQFAEGQTPIMRAYFFSNGISGYFDNGSSPGISSNTVIDADRYFSPSPNHTNEFIHPIEISQSIGVSSSPGNAPRDRAAASRLFSPAPLALSFGHGEFWSSIGIGTSPGTYQFNGFEFSGEHYAGASFWVDYQGRRTAEKFASPIVAIHFGSSSLGTLDSYIRWIDGHGFSTHNNYGSVPWHRLPIFCGWAEQTAIAGSESPDVALSGRPRANQLATQQNYTAWIKTLDQRGIPAGTIVIDDKWSTTYGGLEIDQQKWTDMKRFVDEQHARGRHVLLWIPVASAEGLPKDLAITRNGISVAADVSNLRYEAFLRHRIRHLVADIGIDGFKEDWVGPPSDFADVQESGDLYGIEFVRRFQFILYDETHRAKPDAMIETQTPNPLFRESSDVLRLNDVYTATRNVAAMMRIRAEIARAAGWKVIDTDNASTTTLFEWWRYMLAQPSIGVPALYFVTETAQTHERPSNSQWSSLAALWRNYIRSLAGTSLQEEHK